MGGQRNFTVGDADAQVAELTEDHLGHEQIAGEPVGARDEHQADATRANALEQGAKAFTITQVARAAHTLVAILADHFDAVCARVARDRIALAREAVALDLSAGTRRVGRPRAQCVSQPLP
jgi:hypothetical protein